MALTTMVESGVWDVVDISKKYHYRVATMGKGQDWSIYKFPKGKLIHNDPWEFVESGFKTKASAVEYVEELAAKEDFNPVADHLNNIDDGIDLDNEGGC
jgi:hypothetical protein